MDKEMEGCHEFLLDFWLEKSEKESRFQNKDHEFNTGHDLGVPVKKY